MREEEGGDVIFSCYAVLGVWVVMSGEAYVGSLCGVPAYDCGLDLTSIGELTRLISL